MKTNYLKLGILSLMMMVGATVNAQSTADQTKDTKAVRVIDNKGTIKYLQSNNGITSITNTTANVTTTTWQLGGTLVDNTYIDADGKVFALDGLELVTNIAKASTNVDADLNNSDHDDDAGAGSTGFTVLIRDEDSGTFQKIRVSDLLQVQSSQSLFLGVTDITVDTAKTITGLPADHSKVNVYRNGAKLIANLDYTVAVDALTLVDKSTATDPSNWTLYTGDSVEVHWFK